MPAALLTTTLSFIFRNCPIHLTLWIMMNIKCWVFIPNLKVYLTIWNTGGLKRNPLLIHLTGNLSINCWYSSLSSCVNLFLMSPACYRATPAWTCWTSACGTPGSTTYRSAAPPTGSSRSSATRTSPRVAGRSVHK